MAEAGVAQRPKRTRRSELRARLVGRVALVAATVPGVIAVVEEARDVIVMDRLGRSRLIRSDLTIVSRGGIRTAIVVAPRPAVALSVDWPVRIVAAPMTASAPRFAVALCRVRLLALLGSFEFGSSTALAGLDPVRMTTQAARRGWRRDRPRDVRTIVPSTLSAGIA